MPGSGTALEYTTFYDNAINDVFILPPSVTQLLQVIAGHLVFSECAVRGVRAQAG